MSCDAKVFYSSRIFFFFMLFTTWVYCLHYDIYFTYQTVPWSKNKIYFVAFWFLRHRSRIWNDWFLGTRYALTWKGRVASLSEASGRLWPSAELSATWDRTSRLTVPRLLLDPTSLLKSEYRNK
jgi:hypothetical protein